MENTPPHPPTSAAAAQAAMDMLLHAQGAGAISDIGAGRPIVLLHGGGGPATLRALAQTLATQARVLLPTHPGFEATPRPPHLACVADLARLYVQWLDALDLRNVVLIGSSLGGWIAAEMALADSARIAGMVLMNPVGIAAPSHPVTDVSRLTRPELVRLASHNAERMLTSAPPPTPQQIAILASNAAALAAYDAGACMMADGLRERLAQVQTPALVLWGTSDGIASTDYGKAYAQAFANGRFEPISEAGHLPHIEQPGRVLQHIEQWIQTLEVDAAQP